MPEQDWDEVLRKLRGSRHKVAIDGRDHAGTVSAINVTQSQLDDGMDAGAYPGAQKRAIPATTYGVTLAAAKDYVPNQENTNSGSQQPMALSGKEWEPVDNLFVLFLPFGNMIGVVAESVSSSRATKFADWLTGATKHLFASDQEFFWAAVPVIDQARKELLSGAKGLKSVVFAGEMGEMVANDASGLKELFGIGSNRTVDAIRIEIKITPVQHKGTVDDQEAILDWYNQTVGSLSGQVDKAQVTLSADQDTPLTEIDLLHQRLTRSTRISIQNGSNRAFTATSAVGAIVDAFVLDRDDLLRLRDSDD